MRQRAHCLLNICWEDRKWTTATILPAFAIGTSYASYFGTSCPATGLDEHMEVEKEKSDDGWMIADPVPLTTEMVGSFLQD